MRIGSLALAALSTALAATAQPARPTCNGQTCTFTLGFDDGNGNAPDTETLTGAAYSGQTQFENLRTMPNGTHMSSGSPGVMTYRDASGRVRIEYHAYRNSAPNRPAPADDFIIATIRDPIAGYQYVLDPVNRVAHRMPFQETGTQNWNPSRLDGMLAGGSTDSRSTTLLGTQTISGVTAWGRKVTETQASPAGGTSVFTMEDWFAPKTGVRLLTRQSHDTDDDVITVTITNYSEAEPDASLFQIPAGYQTVDETGAFQVVHPHAGTPAYSSSSDQLKGTCNEGVCTITFIPGSGRQFAVIGAPYSGHEVRTSGANNSAASIGVGFYRDSDGRLRTDPFRVGPQTPPLVKIDDPVGGFLYILDPTGQTAYRIKTTFNANMFRPSMAQPDGTRTAPNGIIFTVENPGPQTISGVTATGQRTTTTYPPGTQVGNDKTIVTVTERWIDPKTGVNLQMKNTTIEGNTLTMTVPDYKEGDPDPALFRIPADYRIIDEAGEFSFTAPAATK